MSKFLLERHLVAVSLVNIFLNPVMAAPFDPAKCRNNVIGRPPNLGRDAVQRKAAVSLPGGGDEIPSEKKG
jgi:hypothetical protein